MILRKYTTLFRWNIPKDDCFLTNIPSHLSYKQFHNDNWINSIKVKISLIIFDYSLIIFLFLTWWSILYWWCRALFVSDNESLCSCWLWTYVRNLRRKNDAYSSFAKFSKIESIIFDLFIGFEKSVRHKKLVASIHVTWGTRKQSSGFF